jgi:hypothetical protein
MKLYIVPTTHVQQYWHLAEPLLQLALDKGNDEFTADQLKLMVTQGQQQLLLLMKDTYRDKCVCALTVQWIMYPNDRVCYITYIGGKNTKAGFEQFKNWARSNGGTCIQGSTKYESIVKLFNRLYGYKKKYTLMELKL